MGAAAARQCGTCGSGPVAAVGEGGYSCVRAAGRAMRMGAEGGLGVGYPMRRANSRIGLSTGSVTIAWADAGRVAPGRAMQSGAKGAGACGLSLAPSHCTAS